MEEKELIQKFRDGDPSAFKTFFGLYSEMVFNVCCRMLGNRQDGEDVTQEVFTDAFRSIGKFRSESKLSTWLYRITVNHCLNFQAREKRDRFFSLDFFNTGSETQAEKIPESLTGRPDLELEKKEIEQILLAAVNTLPEGQRTSIILHRYEGLSYQEIAEIMNCSVSSVESRLFRAKQNLCRKLRPYLSDL